MAAKTILWSACLVTAGLGCVQSESSMAPPVAPPASASPVAGGASVVAGAPSVSMTTAPPVGMPAAGMSAAQSMGSAGASAPPVAAPVAPTVGAAGVGSAMDPSACDRACLKEFIDSYFAALAARDPTSLKVSASLKFTENGEARELGEGLWEAGAEVRDDTRMDAFDVPEGQAGCQVVLMDEEGMPVIFQLRLKVVAREITEVETMVVRQQGAANGFFSVDGMVPQPVFKEVVDPERQMTREALKATVDKYFDALDTGNWQMAMTKFDADCARYENGFPTATSAMQITSQRFDFDVVRRYLIIDQEAGLVWGMFPFTQGDNTLVVAELFKVMDDQIMMIQAVMAYMPAKAWD